MPPKYNRLIEARWLGVNNVETRYIKLKLNKGSPLKWLSLITGMSFYSRDVFITSKAYFHNHTTITISSIGRNLKGLKLKKSVPDLAVKGTFH